MRPVRVASRQGALNRVSLSIPFRLAFAYVIAVVSLSGASASTGVLALGGSDNTTATLASAEFYDPAANTWSPVPAMSFSRYWPAAAPVTVSGFQGVLAIGGGS